MVKEVEHRKKREPNSKEQCVIQCQGRKLEEGRQDEDTVPNM